MDEAFKQLIINFPLLALTGWWLKRLVERHNDQAIDRERALTNQCTEQRNHDSERCDRHIKALGDRLNEVEDRQINALSEQSKQTTEAMRELILAIKEAGSGVYRIKKNGDHA